MSLEDYLNQKPVDVHSVINQPSDKPVGGQTDAMAAPIPEKVIKAMHEAPVVPVKLRNLSEHDGIELLPSHQNQGTKVFVLPKQNGLEGSSFQSVYTANESAKLPLEMQEALDRIELASENYDREIPKKALMKYLQDAPKITQAVFTMLDNEKGHLNNYLSLDKAGLGLEEAKKVLYYINEALKPIEFDNDSDAQDLLKLDLNEASFTSFIQKLAMRDAIQAGLRKLFNDDQLSFNDKVKISDDGVEVLKAGDTDSSIYQNEFYDNLRNTSNIDNYLIQPALEGDDHVVTLSIKEISARIFDLYKEREDGFGDLQY